jgi:hypothetical protein
MAIFVTANFLEIPATVHAFGANNVLTRQGLVMGAGAALAVKLKYPDAPKLLGDAIDSLEEFERYGWVVVPTATGQVIGAFQSKTDWRLPSRLEYVQFSATALNMWLLRNPEATVSLAFPGIGRGGLATTHVKPILEMLPDRVTICTLERS